MQNIPPNHHFFAFPHGELRLPRNSLQSIMHADDNVAPNWEIGHGGWTDEADIQGVVINADFYRSRLESEGHISRLSSPS